MPHDSGERRFNFSITPQILWKEVVVWKRLSHENVLPFYGVDTINFQLALVYDWADSGNINQYLNSHPKTSRTRLVLLSSSHPPRLFTYPKLYSKVHEVAQGLRYLHSFGIVHGDLKGVSPH